MIFIQPPRKTVDLSQLYTTPMLAFATADGLIDGSISGKCMARVRWVAAQRQAEAVRARRPNRHGADSEDGGLIHLLGACGEYAAACVLGVPWKASINTFKEADLLDFIQVRARSEPWHELPVRDDDKPSEAFVLVTLDLTAHPPLLIAHGYIDGREAKVGAYRGNPGGRGAAYWVPQSRLEPLTCSSILDRLPARA
jgi:hypothetical protein